jgi:hypothetical protein
MITTRSRLEVARNYSCIGPPLPEQHFFMVMLSTHKGEEPKPATADSRGMHVEQRAAQIMAEVNIIE